MSKPRTRNNQRAGRYLQKLRIENGIMEQKILSDLNGWKENRIRDREIAVASLTLPEIVRLSICFNMSPVLMAKRMIAPISISLDKVTVDNDSIGIWEKTGRLGQSRRWANAIIEKDYPGNWKVFEDYEDALQYFNDTIVDIRQEIEWNMRKGEFTPTELIDTTHLGSDWERAVMVRQGRNLKAARLRKSLASQWAAASKLNLNSSHVQVRESAAVSIKLEDIIWYATGWDMSPYKLVEAVLSETSPTDQELRELRRKYC